MHLEHKYTSESISQLSSQSIAWDAIKQPSTHQMSQTTFNLVNLASHLVTKSFDNRKMNLTTELFQEEENKDDFPSDWPGILFLKFYQRAWNCSAQKHQFFLDFWGLMRVKFNWIWTLEWFRCLTFESLTLAVYKYV